MSDNDVILGLFALILVVFSLVVALLIPRRDPGFPGANLRVFLLVAVLLVVAMLAAVEVVGGEHEEGEGAGGEAQATETGTAETGQTETGQTETGGAGAAQGDPEAGEDVFVSAGCGDCHVLEEAGTSGTIGPSLDESQVDVQAAVEQVTNGGGAMPAFSGQLSEQEIQDVAAFVVASEG